MASRDRVLLSHEPLDLGPLSAGLEDAACGALCDFVGRVRDEHLGRKVRHLHYEAFEPMARQELHALLRQVRQRWDLGPLVLAHRLGRLGIGEVAVYVGVASGHRHEAFEACRALIEGIKDRAPIWKHEFYADGSEAWVGAPGWREPVLKEAP